MRDDTIVIDKAAEEELIGEIVAFILLIDLRHLRAFLNHYVIPLLLTQTTAVVVVIVATSHHGQLFVDVRPACTDTHIF
jgi:hypothetical protein